VKSEIPDSPHILQNIVPFLVISCPIRNIWTDELFSPSPQLNNEEEELEEIKKDEREGDSKRYRITTSE